MKTSKKKYIIDSIKGGARAVAWLDTPNDEALHVELVNRQYVLSYCWLGDSGWEAKEQSRIRLGDEKRLARLMFRIVPVKNWGLTLAVPFMQE